MSNTQKSKNYVVYSLEDGAILAVFGTVHEPIIEDGQAFIISDCDDIKKRRVNLNTLKVV